MLRSKYTQEPKNTFRATKIFTDRMEPRAVFDKSIEAFSQGRKPSELLIYYGVGGIGKTKLLKELYHREEPGTGKNKALDRIFVSLDAYDYANPVDVLIAIRKQLEIDCGLFDYALLQYSVKAKNSIEDISHKIKGLDGPLMDLVNELLSLGMGSITVPANLLRKSVGLIRDISFKKQYKEEIAAIEDYSETEVYQRLPYYLGLSVKHATENGKKHIIFIDSYESILLKTNNTALIEDSEEWLKELFLSSETVLFVIASREKIKWYEDDPEWDTYLNQHIIERLSDEDSMYFLRQVPVSEEDIAQAIVKLSQGVPLYLDMCVDLYESYVNDNIPISKELFNVTGNKIIKRYIGHLKDSEKYAIKVLSVVNFFDLGFADYLLKSENILLYDDALRCLIEKSIFLELDKQQKIFKIDESVRQHILGTLEEEKKSSVVRAVIRYIQKNMLSQPALALKYYEQLFKILLPDPGYFERHTHEIINIMITLIDMGFWCEIHHIGKQGMNSNNNCIKSICGLAELLYLRRTARIKEAKYLIGQGSIDAGVLGNYSYFYEFLKIHMEHLSGNYDYALDQYQRLSSKISLIKENMEAHTYYIINIKYIDLLFLKGRFKTARALIDDLADNNNIQLPDKMEILRVRGHIYRFNFMQDEAADIYQYSLNMLQREPCLPAEGKLYNNLAETYAFTDPETALKYAAKSIEINEKIDSKIELGKTYAACSIAYSMLNQRNEAFDYAHRSISLQMETGYSSGELFGRIALYFAMIRNGEQNQEAGRKLWEKIKEDLSRLNVYGFLLLPVLSITGKQEAMEEEKERYEWIDFKATLRQLSKI